MGGNLRILHTADSHIGAELPVRPRLDRPRRGDDFVDSFARVLARAMSGDIDLVIHSGDLFNRSKPSSRALTVAAEPILEVAAAGVPVVIAPGNHERSTIPACVLLSHPNIHIISDARTLVLRIGGVRVAVSGFPCLRRDSAKRFASALEATDWHKARADLRILAVHQTFESATCGPANHRFRSGDDVVERTDIPSEFDYVAAGHIHRHQVLAAPVENGPPIVYAGSPDRISFAEVDEPKGYVLLECDSRRVRHSFLEHTVRPMSVHPLDVTALSRGQIEERVVAILEALPEGAMSQLRFAGSVINGTLRGLQLEATARRLRPDVLFSLSVRAVEFGRHKTTDRAVGGPVSVVSGLGTVHEWSATVAVDDVARLPKGGGVYALLGGDGRLLYIGKSRNVRTRVRSHIRGDGGASFFAGWTRQVERVEALPTHSDLESLLIESELIRALDPPFNRQMRRWRRYCYLCEDGATLGRLEVRPQPIAGGRCFGPFRSRQLAATVRDAVSTQFGLALFPDETPPTKTPAPKLDTGLLRLTGGFRVAVPRSPCGSGAETGPAASTAADDDRDSRLRRRDDLLGGLDDTEVRELEVQLETASDELRASHDFVERSRMAWILRNAFDLAATLRTAEELMDGLLLLPGPVGRRKTASFSTRGVRFDHLRNDPADAERVLRRHARLTSGTSTGVSRLPKTSMDSMCILARCLARHDGGKRGYCLLLEEELRDVGAHDLLERAFEGDGRTSEGQVL